MDIQAVVYTSNTGYTAECAQLLGKKLGLRVFSLDEAKTALVKDTKIIYLGWLMGGLVKGYNKAKKRFVVRAVCGVGMGAPGSQIQEIRKINSLPENVPAFCLRGGFDMRKLKGIYKFMMTFMVLHFEKTLGEKPDLDPDEEAIVDMVRNGASYVREADLAPVIKWYKNR